MRDIKRGGGGLYGAETESIDKIKWKAAKETRVKIATNHRI